MRRCFIVDPNAAYKNDGGYINFCHLEALISSRAGYMTYLIFKKDKLCSKEDIENYTGHRYEFLELKPSKKECKNKILLKIFNIMGISDEGYSERIVEILKELNITSNDFIIFSGHRNLQRKLCRLREQYGCKLVLYNGELFSKEDFFDTQFPKLNYYLYMREVKSGYNSDLIFTLSHFARRYYSKHGCNCDVMVPFCDFQGIDRNEHKMYDEKRIKFILPFPGKMKDLFQQMLIAFANLPLIDLKRIEIHITGMSTEGLRKYIDGELYRKLKDNIISHGWLSYKELCLLYQEVNYLVILRQESQMTLANFPSKVVETMNYGIVPICSDVGDYTKYYLTDRENSIFIKENTAGGCTNALREVLGFDQKTYMQYSLSALNCAREKFDYHVWVEFFRNSIESLWLSS